MCDALSLKSAAIAYVASRGVGRSDTAVEPRFAPFRCSSAALHSRPARERTTHVRAASNRSKTHDRKMRGANAELASTRSALDDVGGLGNAEGAELLADAVDLQVQLRWLDGEATDQILLVHPTARCLGQALGSIFFATTR